MNKSSLTAFVASLIHTLVDTLASCIATQIANGTQNGTGLARRTRLRRKNTPEYDGALLYVVSFYAVSFHYFVTKACARRPGAAASVERRRRERRTLLAGAAGELAGVTRLRQARPSSACTFSGAYTEICCLCHGF